MDASASLLTIKDSVFSSNTAGNSGGAIFVASTSTYLRNVKFLSNQGCTQGNGVGGALSNTGANKSYYWLLYGVQFSGNTCEDDSNSDDVYTNNSSDGIGGGSGIPSTCPSTDGGYTSDSATAGSSITCSCNGNSCSSSINCRSYTCSGK